MNWCLRSVVLICCYASLDAYLFGQSDNQTLPDWLADFDSENVIVRRSTASKLKSSKAVSDPRVMERMSKLLFEEKDAQVRLTILDIAIDLGAQARPLIPALVESLRKEASGRKNEELHQDHREALALASIGPAAEDGLRELLTCSRTNVRAEAAMALAKIGPSAASAMRDVLPLLDDKEDRVRDEATAALAAFGDVVQADLKAAFVEGSTRTQCGIVRALGQMPNRDAQTINIILRAIESEDVELRIAGLDVLGQSNVDPMQCRSILLNNLSHPNESVRRAVIRQLSNRYQDLLAPMQEELVKLVASGESGVVKDAAFLIARLGTDGASALIGAMRHSESDIEVIADALGTMGASVFDLLASSMSAPESSVRRGCALALGQIRPLPEKAIDVLIVGLQDVDHSVQLASLRALGKLQSRATKASQHVRPLLEHPDAVIRAMAHRILFEIGPRNVELAGLLQNGLNDHSDEVQLVALHALKSMGPVAKAALPDVMDKLLSSHRQVQLSALAMIGSFGRAAVAATPKLIPLIQDDRDTEFILAVLQTLTQFGNEAAPALQPVKQLLHASDSRVRAAAIDVFSNLELPIDQVQPILSPLFADSDQEVRKRALRAIRKYGNEGILFVADLISQVKVDEKADSYLLREIQRLEKVDVTEAAIAPLLTLLDHANPKVVALACKFLGRVRPPQEQIVSRLSALGEHADPTVREAAAQALKPMP